MKNFILQLSITITAFVALVFLLSYTHPAADEPKQYTIVWGSPKDMPSFETKVNHNLGEGWRLQGGVCVYGQSHYQAMVK